MRATEFIIENIELEDLDPIYVNKTIQKTGAGKWVAPGGAKKVPKGATASVWQHVDDPDKVVKVVGGGTFQAEKHERDGTVAYVDFLVHNGYKSTHLPIVHGIDVGKEVVQVRMETLQELNIKMGRELANLSSDMFKPLSRNDFNNLLKQQGLSERNSYDSIVKCIKLLNTARIEYGKKYGLRISLDLHGGNWLKRSDGTIVAADPWYSR